MNELLKKHALSAAVSLALLGGMGAAQAAVNVQCPNDDDARSDAVVDIDRTRPPTAARSSAST